MGTCSTLALLSLTSILSFSGTVFAADPDPMLEKVTALEKQVATDIEAKANEALVGDTKSAQALYRDVEGKDALKERIVTIVGSITKVRADDVSKAAILMLGEIGDLRGARYLRSFLRAVDTFKVPLNTEASIEASKKLPDSTLVEPLLDIVDNSKNVACAAKAIEALGYFGSVKSKREKILVELCKSVQRNLPGRKGQGGNVGSSEAGSGPDGVGGSGDSGSGTSGGGSGGSIDPGTGGSYSAGQANSARWPALSEVLPEALNKLTGSVCSSAQDWFAMVKQHKTSLKVLFVADTSAPPAPDAPPK